jgi:hypothetical protein
MSKADSLTLKPAPGIDRRGLIVGAGGVAVAAAPVATPAFASEGPSQEFVQYLRCRQAHIASCEREPEALFEDPEYEKWEAKQD